MKFHVIPNYTGALYLCCTRIKRNIWHSSCCCELGKTLQAVARIGLRQKQRDPALVPIRHEIGSRNVGIGNFGARLDESAQGGELATKRKVAGG